MCERYGCSLPNPKRGVVANALRGLRYDIRLFSHRLGFGSSGPRARTELACYWQDPSAENKAETYLVSEGSERSNYLVFLLRKFRATGPLLELGCNAGRNLNFLYDAGWSDLSAIEISSDALDLFRKALPAVAESTTLHNGPLETELPKLGDGQFDTVFSMAVLEHVHYASDWIFDHILRVSRHLVVTIENEADFSDRTFPRCYRREFEKRGAFQIYEEAPVPGLSYGFVARIFSVAR